MPISHTVTSPSIVKLACWCHQTSMPKKRNVCVRVCVFVCVYRHTHTHTSTIRGQLLRLLVMIWVAQLGVLSAPKIDRSMPEAHADPPRHASSQPGCRCQLNSIADSMCHWRTLPRSVRSGVDEPITPLQHLQPQAVVSRLVCFGHGYTHQCNLFRKLDMHASQDQDVS